MNTISIPASSRPLMGRFVWKEYRMLRGFWLAGLVIAVLMQLLVSVTSIDRPFVPRALLMIAWGAAALYAVGAAITMFSAESEERTRDYLRLLPGDWRQIFSTKVLMALGTAALLGGALSLTGRWIAGDWPTERGVAEALGIAGVAVLEGLAWGLLFSLWWKHPLLAAIAAIAAASFGAQWAIVATTDSGQSWTGEAYVSAVPGRLAVCLVVFAVDVWLGRRWLYPVPTKVVAAKPTSGKVKVATKSERPRLKMFSRLLWQTWRESWKPILVAVPLSFGLIAAFLAPASLLFGFHNEDYALWLMSLILPAIVGSLVFRADQQKDHRLFLATHAAWPRYVWLARHVLWLGTVVLLSIVATLIVTYLFQALIGYELLRTVKGYERYGSFDSHGSVASAMELGWQLLLSGIITAWCAVISAYAVGQVCSILFKRTVLAGFAAILLSVVLAAWSILMFAWQMNPMWFVLPIGAGALFATWLRVPSWILQLNRWKHRVAPAVAVLLPLTFAIVRVPTARMAQIEDIELPAYDYLREPLEVSVQEFSTRQKRQTESMLKLERLGIAEEPWIEDIVLDGKKFSEFELSERALEFYGPGASVGYYGEHVDELDPAEVEVLNRFQAEATRQALEANRAKIPELLAIVNSPDFQPLYGGRYSLRDRYSAGRLLGEFATLLANDAKLLSATGDLDEAWQRLRAIPLIDPQLWYSERRFDFYEEVSAWAAHPDQASDRLKHAVVDLQRVFARLPEPRDIVLENREHVRGVVLHSQPSGQSPAKRQLYYFLNSLPGEQARALRALDLLTTQALNQIDAVTAFAVGEGPGPGMGRAENVGDLLRAWYREVPVEVYDGRSKERIRKLQQAFETSFLAENEFDYGDDPLSLASNWVGDETQRRGLLLQLALIAYRIDNGTYPKSLTELLPEYPPEPITDPFSGFAFVYRPQGLPHQLLSSKDGEVEFIAEDTPLIWSVGYDNMQLMEARPIEFIVRQYGGSQSVDEKILAAAEAGEQYYYFRGTERGGSNRYVFPLPKIEPEPPDGDDTAQP